MGVSGSAVILTAFGNVSCGHNGLAAAFYASSFPAFWLSGVGNQDRIAGSSKYDKVVLMSYAHL